MQADFHASGLSTSLALDNFSTVFAGLAISCLDWTHDSTTLADVMYKEQLGSVVAPHTRGASQTYGIQTNCIGWPAPVQNPPHYANVTGTPPILLVNSDHDPECSYVWANGMLAQVSNGTLLTRSGDGHTSYSLNGTTTKAIDAYLVSGEIPPPNTVYTS